MSADGFDGQKNADFRHNSGVREANGKNGRKHFADALLDFGLSPQVGLQGAGGQALRPVIASKSQGHGASRQTKWHGLFRPQTSHSGRFVLCCVLQGCELERLSLSDLRIWTFNVS